MKGRDVLFQELFSRAPTQEELQRFDRMGSLMGLAHDDSMWYVIIVNEFYDNRLKNRLSGIENVADRAADKALQKIAESVNERADSIASQKNRGFLWRSWGLFMSMTVVLCSVVLNAGYVMGSGKYPFWLNPGNSFEEICSWFFNVPTGWIFLLGCSPFFLEVLLASVKQLRYGTEKKKILQLTLKAIASVAMLIFASFVALAF